MEADGKTERHADMQALHKARKDSIIACTYKFFKLYFLSRCLYVAVIGKSRIILSFCRMKNTHNYA